MSTSKKPPRRPSALPRSAVWSPEDRTWGVGELVSVSWRDDLRPKGTWKAYREDGSLAWVQTYHPKWPGCRHGEGRFFAPDGHLERVERWQTEQLAEVQHLTPDGRVERVERFEVKDYEAESTSSDRQESEEGSAEESDPAVERLGRRFLKRGASETAARAVDRLARFCAAAKKQGWTCLPKLKRGQGLSARALATAEKELDIKLPAALARHLGAFGGLTLNSDLLTLRYAAKPAALAFDVEVGQVLDAGYAKLYGLRKQGFNQEKVDRRFVRLALAAMHFEDDDVHEDGDTAVVILDREKPTMAPVVWAVPHDDGYGVGERIGTLDGFVSWAVDRTIRCTIAGQ